MLQNFRFAFIEFNTEADVDTAMEEKQGTDLGGRSLFLDYTGSKSKGAKKSGSFGGAPPQQRKSFGGELGDVVLMLLPGGVEYVFVLSGFVRGKDLCNQVVQL